MLFQYMQQTQRFLREQRQIWVNPADITDYVNRARREIAMRAKCVRILTPSSGAITGWSVTNAGSGYSNAPTFTVSEPDFPSGALPDPLGAQATATGVVQNGSIAAIYSQYGGSGYFQPTLTIEDSTGSGAEAEAQLTFINQLSEGQEQYPFSDIDLSMNPGCESVFMIQSITIIYNNYRYSLPVYSFSTYQAMIRQYPYQYQWVPTMASQFGQGANGSFFVYPLPSQTYQYELDCFCIPSDLEDNGSYEAIPQPWQDAVPYFAAHLGYLELQNFNAAKYYLDLYEKMAQSYSNYARVNRAVNPYGRY